MNALKNWPIELRPSTSLILISSILLLGLAVFFGFPVARGAAALLICQLPLIGLYVLSKRQLIVICLCISASLFLLALTIWQSDPANFRLDQDGFLVLIAMGITLLVGFITVELNQNQLQRCEHRKALEETLENLHLEATKDPQTGLPNQSYMREWLSQAAKRSHRSGLPMCLALLARDDAIELGEITITKAQSTTPDELAIDQLTACAQQVFRENDVTARWSAEELLVLFEGSAPDQAKEGLIRLRQEPCNIAFSSSLVVWHANQSIDDAIVRLRAGLLAARQKGGQCDESV